MLVSKINPKILWQPIPGVTRLKTFILSFLAFCAALLVYLPGFPFDKQFGLVAVYSGSMHFVLFIFFKKLRHYHLVITTYINIILLGFAIHYTGGITSPFIIVLACSLIAIAAYHIEHWGLFPAIFGTYLVVVILEFSGIIEPLQISARHIYSNSWVTILVVIAVTFHLSIVGFSYNIILRSLRSKLEAELAHKQQLIKKMGTLESTAQLGMMVAKIAHDINGPLTAIGGFLQVMLDDESFNKKAREDFDVMFRETKRISAMIDKMLKYVRPGTESKEPICPKDVVETVMTVLQFHPLSKGIQFVKDYQLRDGVLIVGNKQSLQQVYFNIAKNALEALASCKGKKIVTVFLTHDAEKCYVNIADNGPGMSEDILEKVKQGFFTTKEGGTGLGLTVTKEIIDGHQGNFGIESEPGKGTKILTSIPIHDPTAPVVSPSPSVESVV